MFTLVVLVVTMVVCLSHVCFGHFKYLSAHNYKVELTSANAAGLALALAPDCCSSPQIDTKETETEAAENGRAAPPSSSPSNKPQVSPLSPW